MTEYTADELERISERDHQINIDIDRIKRDMAETAKRHGLDTFVLSIDWIDRASGTLAVQADISLF